MGKRGRERVVALTKTRKKLVGRDVKHKILEDLRDAIDKYESIYVLSTGNLRNTLLKELRATWRDSRFFFGRNKIAQIAFGRDDAEEYVQGLQQVARQLDGNVGLLFTNRPHDKVLSFFTEYERADFARSGFVATEAVELVEGEMEMFGGSQEHNLRLVGLPVCLKRGKVWLTRDFTVCEMGETLTPEKAKILEFLGVRQALFRIKLRCSYRKSDGHFELLGDGKVDKV